MKPLTELQREFQRHVLAGDAAILRSVEESPDFPAAMRLAIYADAYRLRLVDALASNFPRLQQLLGADEFGALANQYIDARPSTFRSIRWFGDTLPSCLETSEAQRPWLADLASWEWAIASAFDAADAQPLQGDALGRIAPERWATLRFGFHPSLRRVAMNTNAPALFRSLSENQPPPEPQPLRGPQHWLIWRQDLRTNYRSLEEAEAAALGVLVEGGEFQHMCDALCVSFDADEVPLRAAGMLKSWVADGLIVELVDSPAASA